jgi:diadenylate cyclase
MHIRREGGDIVEGSMIQNIMIVLYNIIDTIRISDLIDIAVMSYVIYKLMWMIRKTSSGRVLKGVLILLLAMWLCTALDLYTTSFFLNKAFELGIVVLVILFQPEIRRFLERMGSSSLGFGNMFSQNSETSHDVESAIRETVEAYTSMSKDKVGALMVFERNNLLDEVIKTGTPLDCAVSSELLKNVFWNKAPLHDGAVIVRDGRIVGAGCMLPLSSNVNLSRDLGMRHRAGIGISEHSDAVVVIVSEETGSISAAVGGMLKRHLAPETLERLLRKELIAEVHGEENKVKSLPVLNYVLNWIKKGGEAE